MDERGLCALYLFHALCAVSTRCDKWVSQSVYGRNTKNFPEQIEIETSSFLVVAVNIIHFRFCRFGYGGRSTVRQFPPGDVPWLHGHLPATRPAGCLFVGCQPCDLFSSGGPGMWLGMALRVIQTSPRSGGTIIEEELLCYKFFLSKIYRAWAK